jgi:hypothetical protein
MFTNFGKDYDQFTSLSGMAISIHNARALMMCGQCNEPAAYHPGEDATGLMRKLGFTPQQYKYKGPCGYDFSTDGPRNNYDYFLHRSDNGTTDMTVYVDYANNSLDQYSAFKYGIDVDNEDGTFTNYRVEDNPDNYVSIWDTEYAALDRWHELPEHANETTVVLDENNPYPSLPYNFNGDRTAFVEGLDGFIARQYLDLNTTSNYHKRLINSFVNKKTGKFHVGSIAFDFNGPMVTATCINRDCSRKCDDGQYRQVATSLDRNVVTDVAVMEWFVYMVIKHGNNHGPEWLRNRPDFYLMHDFGCDLGTVEKPCNGLSCNNNRIITDVIDTDMDDVTFIMEHQLYCNDKRCGCQEWLASEVPALSIKEVA